MTEKVIVRMPPSPTGLLHVGTVRTALYNYLFARKYQGKYIFRWEDTDRERSKKEYEDNIMSGLVKLGIDFDEGPFRQTERFDIYRQYLIKLLKTNKAYYCFCTKEELEHNKTQQIANKLPPRHECCCEDCGLEKAHQRLTEGTRGTIRFRVPKNLDIVFNDIVRGEVKTNTKEIADFVIAKSLDEPLYNFCVVIDDYEMSITHVIRGEDHISNTPKQILIFQAFGWLIPHFAHLPLILNEDKSKLSKRKNRVSVDDFLADGYLPEALVNFLALLGWNTSDEKEIFSMEELIQEFDLSRVHKGGAIFDEKKLLWINGVWIRQKSLADLSKLIIPRLEAEGINYLIKGEDYFLKALEMVQERMKKLSEAPEFLRFFFVENLNYDQELFIHEKMKVDNHCAYLALENGLNLLEQISISDWNETILEEKLIALITSLGWKNGQLLWPLRVALTGEKFSPGVFELLNIFGKEESLKRIKTGLKILQN